MIDTDSASENGEIAKMVTELIARAKTPRGTVTAACKLVAKELGISHKSVLIISNNGYAGKKTQTRIRELYKSGKISVRHRVSVIVDWPNTDKGRAQKAIAQKLSMEERRRRLTE